MKRVKRESQLYPLVRTWLERRGHHVGRDLFRIARKGRARPRPWENVGLSDTRFDVIGVRSVGSPHHDEVEIVAVEVKLTNRVRVQHLNQAVGYMRFVDRAYFAFTGDYEPDVIDEARRVGIGLLAVSPSGRPKVRVILDAALGAPHPNRRVTLLHALWIHRCALCGAYFFAFTHPDTAGPRNPNWIPLKRESGLPRQPDGEGKFEAVLCEECGPLLGYVRVKQGSGTRWKFQGGAGHMFGSDHR